MAQEPKPLNLYFRIHKETRLILDRVRFKRLQKGQKATVIDLIAEAVEKTFGGQPPPP